ncbi:MULTISPECIES: nuclear transport factor 2 family protein [Flavobacterium]|uniref:Nuclear transport factor 2 family protein n=1 Tax=Flavobacterium keumense TaxID=1306518 RepID=A0ABY8N514_9FLAO|nr:MULTISPECIES: nuclear transport factor 2 family protein [Flavobacterium]WGK94248.1 nuclear transport factor 2 family protein [Flavobacterium keumense]
MKKILLGFLLFITGSLYSQNQEVKNVIETFFQGFHAKDSIVMKSVCSDKLILQSIISNVKGTKLINENSKDFYRSIATIPVATLFEEKLLDYTIQVDGAMAHVWTPYEFFINGKFSHRGVNAFTMYKENENWKIVYIIDTRRK